MSDNQESDMYSRALEKAQKELKNKDDLIIILKMKLNGSKEKVKERDELIKELTELHRDVYHIVQKYYLKINWYDRLESCFEKAEKIK